jgi:hypothetical protein
VRSREPIGAEVADGLVMLSLQEAKYFSLNATGAAIWRRLETPIQLSQLCDEIAGEFNVGPERCVSAVTTFVAKLIDFRVVAVAEPSRNENGS